MLELLVEVGTDEVDEASDFAHHVMADRRLADAAISVMRAPVEPNTLSAGADVVRFICEAGLLAAFIEITIDYLRQRRRMVDGRTIRARVRKVEGRHTRTIELDIDGPADEAIKAILESLE